MADADIEVGKAFNASQQKYTYFLLTAAGAGIALSVNQTHGDQIDWHHAVLATAVFSWGLSFFFGCRRVEWSQSIMFSNSELLKVQSGIHPELSNHPNIFRPPVKAYEQQYPATLIVLSVPRINSSVF